MSPLDEERLQLKQWALQRQTRVASSTGKRSAPFQDCFTFICSRSNNDLVIMDSFMCPGFNVQGCPESPITVPMHRCVYHLMLCPFTHRHTVTHKFMKSGPGHECTLQRVVCMQQ